MIEIGPNLMNAIIAIAVAVAVVMFIWLMARV